MTKETGKGSQGGAQSGATPGATAGGGSVRLKLIMKDAPCDMGVAKAAIKALPNGTRDQQVVKARQIKNGPTAPRTPNVK